MSDHTPATNGVSRSRYVPDWDKPQRDSEGYNDDGDGDEPLVLHAVSDLHFDIYMAADFNFDTDLYRFFQRKDPKIADERENDLGVCKCLCGMKIRRYLDGRCVRPNHDMLSRDVVEMLDSPDISDEQFARVYMRLWHVSDQEMLNTLVYAHTVVHKTGRKTLEYYERVIRQAHDEYDQEVIRAGRLQYFLEFISDYRRWGNEIEQGYAIVMLSEFIDPWQKTCVINDVIRRVSRGGKSIYSLVKKDGSEIVFGTEDKLLSPLSFWRIVHAGSGVDYFPRLAPDDHATLARAIEALARDEVSPMPVPEADRVWKLVEGYLGSNCAVKIDGRYRFEIPGFCKWHKAMKGTGITPQLVGKVLRSRELEGVMRDWDHTEDKTARYWLIPERLIRHEVISEETDRSCDQ